MPQKPLSVVVASIAQMLANQNILAVNNSDSVLETVSETESLVKSALTDVKNAMEPLYAEYGTGETNTQVTRAMLTMAIISALADKGINIQNRVSLFKGYKQHEGPNLQVVIMKGAIEAVVIKVRVGFLHKKQKRPHIYVHLCEPSSTG